MSTVEQDFMPFSWCNIILCFTLDNILCFHGECYCFQEEKREEVKEWVLAVSMDQKVGVEPVLKYSNSPSSLLPGKMQTIVLFVMGGVRFHLA